MTTFIDHDSARRRMKVFLSEKDGNWSVLSGKRIGKTEFAKQIVSEIGDGIVVEPYKEQYHPYAESFILSIFPEEALSDAIYRYGRRDTFTKELFNSMGYDGIADISEVDRAFILRRLIQYDVNSKKYIFANALAKEYSSRYKYIFLDNFYLCDSDNFNWLVEFWNSIKNTIPKIIVICNFELKWKSREVNEHLINLSAPVDIHVFDNEESFCKLIGNTVSFENETVLKRLSREIYNLFEGDAESVIELINLIRPASRLISDEKKRSSIFRTANEIKKREFSSLKNMHVMILRFLAFSLVGLTRNEISCLIEVEENITMELICQLLDEGFINCSVDEKKANTIYNLSSVFLSESVKQACSKEERDFFLRKIYASINYKDLSANKCHFLDIALEVSIEKAKEIILEMLHNTDGDVTNEQFASYVNRYIDAGGLINDELCTLDIVRLLYKYGYYESAEHIIINTQDSFDTYEAYMLKGDIQHILLKSEASETYKVASKLPHISTSQKISAINNYIMSLNQESREEEATQNYKRALNDYENEECIGLVELYRNTNNSFEYNEAMEFTIKGYCLADKIGADFEKYKCLHNICMMRLQYGFYDEVFLDARIKDELTFDTSLRYFSAHPEYRHECAYPLLDLGTVEMFRFSFDNDINHVQKARKYYSDAQLYARSFYARHIAEMGLLVTNTYLYKDIDPDFVLGIILAAQEHYEKERDDIADSRVHRKILLSIILSKIVSGQTNEIRDLLVTVSNYMNGYEIMRFNGLCERADCEDLKKTTVSLNGRNEIYYGSCKFVPWLISMCH